MKVLVVDDDVVSRMVLMHLVDSCGAYEIFEAEDGADAWRQLQEGLRPSICFCDLRMPNMDGMALLARVKEDPALDGIRFVLASSANDHATMAQASSLGAGGYIVKPFEQDLVLAQLAGLRPQMDDAAESPLATMQRLGIDSARLLAYLGGFENQLAASAHELAAVKEGEARASIEKLHAGCVTLGLDGAAGRLHALAQGDIGARSIQAALGAALESVAQQSDRVRKLQS